MAVTSALILLLQAAQVPPSAESAGFGAMWVDWNALGRQSSAAERAPPPVQKRDRADAASLGQRVGESVALRATAGKSALMRAWLTESVSTSDAFISAALASTWSSDWMLPSNAYE